MTKNTMNRSRGASITTRDMLGIVAVIFVVFITVIFIALNFNGDNSTATREKRYDFFNKGWNLQIGDSSRTVDLPSQVVAESNQSIILSKELPQLSQYYAIASRNHHQIMSVYVDGELIYEFPGDSKIFSAACITDDWNIINLNPDMSGKTIRIELSTGKYGFDGILTPIYIGEDNSIIHYIRSTNVIPYAMSVSVLSLGIALVVLGLIYSKYNKDRTQIISGLMLVTIGIWITNRSKMPLLLMGNGMKYFLAFLSLALESILILLYVWEKFKTKKQKRTIALIIIFGVFLGSILLVSFATGYPFDRMVKFVYGAIFLSALYMLIMLWPIAYGKETKGLSHGDLTANRMEFFAANIMTFGVVIGIIFDFFLNHNRIWTDIGAISKIVLNVYAITQISIHIYRSYNGVTEREEIREQLHDSQLELMMGQIQPHFIFNTLSSIRTLTKVDPDIAYDMIYNFSNYLRANIDNVTNLKGIGFAAELDHIKSYVNIEKVRFGDRLNVVYEPDFIEFMVPPLSIQPIIENAIKHGVCKKPEGGTVWLRSYEEGKFNVVEIEDNGIGFDPEVLENLNSIGDNRKSKSNSATESTQVNLTGNGSERHKSTGMKNIILRLKELADANMVIESTPGVGTKIRVFFPKDAYIG